MRKYTYLIVLFLVLYPQFSSAETVTLSTYYPAPFGSYDRLRLNPRGEMTGACQVGTFYTRDTDNRLQYCKETGGGPDAGQWGPLTGVWDRTDNDIFLADSDTVNDLFVGIGDTTPEAVLEISGNNLGNDLFMISQDDGGDGDFMIMKSSGNMGVGKVDPTAKLVVRGASAVGNAKSLLVENSAGLQGLAVHNDGKVGIGPTGATLDKQLEVNGSMDIKVSNSDSQLGFVDTATGDWYAVGLDRTDGRFKINFGGAVGASSQFEMTSDGDVYIGGSLYLKDATHEGTIPVRWVPDINKPGFYPTYAP